MLVDFYYQLKQAQLPVSITEYLMLLEAMEAREILNRCMVDLTPDEQVILTMAEIEGRTSPEIGQLTGKAAGTIRVTLHRAKKKLTDNLIRLQESP